MILNVGKNKRKMLAITMITFAFMFAGCFSKNEAIIEENNVIDNDSVKLTTIQKFLNGEGEAKLSDSLISICTETELTFLYEGTIDDILEKYYEDFAKYLNMQQISDLKVNVSDLQFANGEKYTYVWINGELNQSNDLFLLLMEKNNQIKICFEGQNSEHTEFYFQESGRIDELSSGNGKHYAKYYYLNEKGDVVELFSFTEYNFAPQNNDVQKLDLDDSVDFNDVYIHEYAIDGRDYYAIEFGESIERKWQDSLLSYIIENIDVKNRIYATSEMIEEKMRYLLRLHDIDYSVISDFKF